MVVCVFASTEYPDPLDKRLQVFRGGGGRRGQAAEGGHPEERGDCRWPQLAVLLLRQRFLPIATF